MCAESAGSAEGKLIFKCVFMQKEHEVQKVKELETVQMLAYAFCFLSYCINASNYQES